MVRFRINSQEMRLQSYAHDESLTRSVNTVSSGSQHIRYWNGSTSLLNSSRQLHLLGVASFPSGSYKWRWRMKKSNRFIEMPLAGTFKETVKSISFSVAVGVVNAARGFPLILPKPLTTARHLINHFTVHTQEHLRGVTCMIYGQKEGVTFKRESGQSVVSL